MLANLQRHIYLDDVSDQCYVIGLYVYQRFDHAKQHWIAINSAAPCDPVADIICEPSVSVANSLHDILKPNGTASIVCADVKHRFGVDHLYQECERVGLTLSTKNITTDTSNSNKNDDDDIEEMIRLDNDDVQY